MIGRFSGRKVVQRSGFLVGVMVAMLALAVPIGATAAEAPVPRDDRPARGIGLYTDYSGVVIPLGESVRMELTVENRGKQDEVVDLELGSVPKGWTAALKGGSFTVTGVAVPSGKTRSLAFSAEPGEGAGPRHRHLHDRRAHAGRAAHGRLSHHGDDPRAGPAGDGRHADYHLLPRAAGAERRGV